MLPSPAGRPTAIVALLRKHGDRNETIALHGLTCILNLTSCNGEVNVANARLCVEAGARAVVEAIAANPAASAQAKSSAQDALKVLSS